MTREKSTTIAGLHLTVPSFFKCPISMDVMTSPVSLSTGVTYDRTNIQKWLDSGHNTCPATMQVLQSTDVVPNLTLRRLIRVWSDSYLLTPESNISFNNHLAFETIKKFIQTQQQYKHVSVSMLSSIVSFAKVSSENCKLLAKLDGFVKSMVVIFETSDDQIQVVPLVLQIFDLILVEKDVTQQLIQLLDVRTLDSFKVVFQRNVLDDRITAARVLETLAACNIEIRRAISDDVSLLKDFYSLINSDNYVAVETGLALLITGSTTRQAKKELVRLGIVRAVGKILAGPENKVALIEKCMKMLEMASTCTEGRTTLSEDDNAVCSVVQRLMKVSTAATEHGIGVIWSLCYMSRDKNAQEIAMRNNGLTKVLLVMQSNCSGTVRQMCGELVKVFRVNSKSCLASYETRTTHIMPY